MKPNSCLCAGALLLSLAACVPLAADYTDSEWPKTIRVDNASSRIAVHFVPGTDRLVPADLARLRWLAAAGYIGQRDRITVAIGGPSGVGDARFGTIAETLEAYRIVPLRTTVAAIRPDEAVLDTGRYLVTLPPCPNWSKPPALHFTNSDASNLGCADAVNLAGMIWHPADLVAGVPHEVSYTPTPNDTPTGAHPLITTGSAAPVVPAADTGATYSTDISGALTVLPSPPTVSPPGTLTSGAATNVVNPTITSTPPPTGGH